MKAKNKDMASVESKENKEASELQEFFFSGGTVYKPVTVRAVSRAEAEAEWERVRVSVITS